MRPTPHPSCRGKLTSIIEIRQRLIYEIRQEPTLNKTDLSWGFSLAVALQDANVEEIPPFNQELRTFILANSSYSKREARALLDQLLIDDQHLHRCCLTAWGLARSIDILAPEALETMSVSFDEGGVDAAVSRMIELLYEDEFRRNIFLRIYNLSSDCLPIEIPYFKAELIKLEPNDIALLLGESTSHSVLHDPNTGACFLKFVTTELGDDRQAFEVVWSKAQQILTILKYVKYGALDIDYGAIYYAPSWVTEIRRPGLGFWGQPRRDKQSAFYELTKQEIPRASDFFSAYVKLKSIIDDPNVNSLRLAVALAAQFYEWHYRKTETERDQRLVELVTALEALFSPRKEGELRFRVAQRAALFLGKDAAARAYLSKFFKTVYDGRSQILHSGVSAFDPPGPLKEKQKDLTVLSSSQLAELGDLVRQALLRALILVWRREDNREEMNSKLDRAALDETIREELFERSDIEQALQEILKS